MHFKVCLPQFSLKTMLLSSKICANIYLTRNPSQPGPTPPKKRVDQTTGSPCSQVQIE